MDSDPDYEPDFGSNCKSVEDWSAINIDALTHLKIKNDELIPLKTELLKNKHCI